MRFDFYPIILMFSLFLNSCFNENEQYRQAERSLAKLHSQHQNLKADFDVLHQEQEKTLRTSAKERFAFLKKIERNKWISFDDSGYIREVQFQGTVLEKGKQVYKTQIKFKTEKIGVKPSFTIRLYGSHGLIVGELEYKKGLFTQKLPQGQTIEKSYNIILDDMQEVIYYHAEILSSS